jgi:alpha-tubulin suppressor-like RCC1 family protein
MSIRQQNLGSIVKPGFNPLVAPTPSAYLYNLYSWGSNSNGQLALGNTVATSSPNQVGALTNWLSVAAGYYTGSAIKTDGTLWTWGNAQNGVLGLGNLTRYSSPKQVGALTDWLQISCNGVARIMAVKTDGTLWAWGQNNFGQLGLGDVSNRSSPVQVGALTGWLNVSAGYEHTCAVKTNGTLWAWGQNASGQLGLGNLTYYSSPKQVGALTNWYSVCCGYNYSYAIKTDGTIWSWGKNQNGQLGLSNYTYRSSPNQIGALTTWARLSSSSVGQASYAIKTDGTLWSWGTGNLGCLGLGNTTAYNSPKQVGALTTWYKVSGGNSASSVIASKTNETVWVWGDNTRGALGLGNTTNRSSPVQLGSLATWGDIATCGLMTFALLY